MHKLSSFALLSLLAPLPAFAEVPQVVTDLPAVQSLAAQVMGDLGSPAVLLEQGGNAHTYQLKPSQLRALEGADLVFWVGPEMTPWLDRALDATAPKGVQIALLADPGTHRQDFPAGAHDDDDDDHAAETEAGDHDDHEGEGEEHHHHSGLDPHAWLDPANAEHWLGVIAEALAKQDPEHAETYRANATAAAASIADLDAKLTAELAPVKDRRFVVFHAAYGYFVDHYGLMAPEALALGDATDPGAAHIAELRAELKSDKIVCAFPEAQHDPKQLTLLLDGTGVKLGGALDPSGSALPYGPGLYAALMQGLADTLTGCLAK
ncbi:MAG: zinc ABC transporter substrate-binding protein [Paenirhodobacter sp.]|uniref:zinc ABC transporter substrate-binding protein n=1 Tax=Paenirhodobacter sp. TaxID=1965326 RepID=UPI003D140C10